MRNHQLCVAASLTFLLLMAPPAQAIWGLLGKVGSGASKAGTAAKGAATAGAAATGVEVAGVANSGAKAAGALAAGGAEVSAASKTAKLSAASADEISAASGLGKAVPDEITNMLNSSKWLAEVPDAKVHAWLNKPLGELKPMDAQAMVSDYARLLDKPNSATKKATTQSSSPSLPTKTPAKEIHWYQYELIARAAHLGHNGAQQEQKRLCQNEKPRECSNRFASQR